MIITPATIKALFTGFNKNFQDGLAGVETQWQDIATKIPSSTISNTYGWLGQWPGFREWVGDRQHKDMMTKAYQLINKHFESSVAVNRNDIDDDNLGVYAPMMTEMGRASGVLPDELIFSALAAAFTTECYDGQNFFDPDHPVAPKTDGTGEAQTVSNMTDGDGLPWFLLDTSRSLKPLIIQERKAPQFTAMTKANDESVYMRNEYRFGVDTRLVAGHAFWQMAHGSKAVLNYQGIWAAHKAMTTLKADGGRPLGVRPNTLVVPAALGDVATQILTRDNISDGTTTVSNELKGKYKLLVSRHL